MKLGTYVEISTTVDDDKAALAFYQTLGFHYQGYRVLTDGSINLNMAPPGVPAPMLRYAGSDIAAVQAAGIELEPDERGLATFITPEGLHMVLSPHESRIAMPEGTPMTRTPLSRCGTFGEYALPVADLSAAIAYWQKLGFTSIHTANENDPFAILVDELLVIGLHQTNDFREPHITYFAANMAERIRALQEDGIDIALMPQEEGDTSNGDVSGARRRAFFLFQGII
ncbi:MAG: hypothetical protein HC914_21100 [Chloroflexaceae bacterium]|nr:hypothetical protein [Chloroflexaceae bacterium]